MIGLVRQASDSANRVTEWALVPIVAFFTFLLVILVFSRYAFQLPIVTSIELVRLAFAWGCFLGAAVGLKRSAHVRVVALVSLFPAPFQRLTPLVVHGGFLVFSSLMVWHGWTLASRMFSTTFPTLGISQGWMYLALPVAGGLMVVHSAAALLSGEAVHAQQAAGEHTP